MLKKFFNLDILQWTQKYLNSNLVNIHYQTMTVVILSLRHSRDDRNITRLSQSEFIVESHSKNVHLERMNGPRISGNN